MKHELEASNIKYPEGEIPLSRFNIAIDEARRDTDNSWEVVRTVKQIVSFDNNTWFIRENAVKALDTSFEKANKTTHKAIGRILDDCRGDFFSIPKWDGMQYIMQTKDVDEVVMEDNHGIAKDVKDT